MRGKSEELLACSHLCTVVGQLFLVLSIRNIFVSFTICSQKVIQVFFPVRFLAWGRTKNFLCFMSEIMALGCKNVFTSFFGMLKENGMSIWVFEEQNQNMKYWI